MGRTDKADRWAGWTRGLVGAAVLTLTVVLGAIRFGPPPPVGHLLDPVYGIWAVARGAEMPRTARGRIRGLDARVDVRYDGRAVPHIFATTEDDAYRALGYVVARDRLFQIELQVRAGAGTLTELVGGAALPLDRETRELGLPGAAERAFASLDTGSTVAHVLRAYADGVNAWIAQLGAAEMPIEYRLLGRSPARWSPVDAYHLLNRMSLILAYADVERSRHYAAHVVGDTVARALFPVHSPLQEPIVPTSGVEPHFRPGHVPLPAQIGAASRSDSAPVGTTMSGAGFAETYAAGRGFAADDRTLGSNNWAVAPRRAQGGFALLAGDPHLDLTLPSLWYETHLVVPGRLNVAGVTIVGGPQVIIGFTPDVAWTFTNTGSDVLDFYVETVDDPRRPRRYRLDGAWRPLSSRIERYRDADGVVLATDTIRYTHRGPMREVDGRWLSMRWVALEGGGALPALLAAPHARSTAEWLQMTSGYDVPAQNMLVADRAGSIAIRSTGVYPVRPGDGRGDIVRDGSTSAVDWRGQLPLDRYPTSMDPVQGFLASANQEPIDPDVRAPAGDAYYGADWPPPWRAIRINTLLRADSSITVDDMRRWQTDPGSARADFFLPYFLAAAHRADSIGRGSGTIHEATRLLNQWDRRYTRDNERAVLFETAMRELAHRVWHEIQPAVPRRRGATPSSAVLAELLRDSSNAWWPRLDSLGGIGPASSATDTAGSVRRAPRSGQRDDRRPADRALESRDQRDALLVASLAAAYDTVRQRDGAPGAGGWRWDRVQHTNIYHLLHIPAFSRLMLPIQGGPETLNPSSGLGTQGSSWRMVVELGPTVRAWATYPGGQSGNPISSRYADRLPQWLAGALDSVRTPRRASDLVPGDLWSRLSLEPTS